MFYSEIVSFLIIFNMCTTFCLYMLINMCIIIYLFRYILVSIISMASLRPTLALVPRVVGRRQFSLSQRLRLQDNWDQECIPGANVPFDSKLKFHFQSDENNKSIFLIILASSKWGLAAKLILYVTSAVAIPFFAMRWQLLKKRAG